MIVTVRSIALLEEQPIYATRAASDKPEGMIRPGRCGAGADPSSCQAAHEQSTRRRAPALCQVGGGAPAYSSPMEMGGMPTEKTCMERFTTCATADSSAWPPHTAAPAMASQYVRNCALASSPPAPSPASCNHRASSHLYGRHAVRGPPSSFDGSGPPLHLLCIF